MSSYAYTLLIPLIPFFVFVCVGMAEDKLKGKLGGLIGTAGLGIAPQQSHLQRPGHPLETGVHWRRWQRR